MKLHGGKGAAWDVIKRISPVLLFFVLIGALIGTDTPKKQAERAQKEERLQLEKALSGEYPMSVQAFSLDTFCTLTLYEGGGSEALYHASERLRAFDELFNQSKEGSDIYRINHRSEDRVAISDETAELLKLAKEISASSDGDFDVTVGELTALWNFKERKTVPPEAEIRKALLSCDPDGFSVEYEADGSAFFQAADDALRIDIGAIAKGYIADRLRESMLSDGVRSGIINLGGNVLCIGELPEKKPFVIGLKRPEQNAEDDIAELKISDLSVVTAGIYERYFEENGVHYHHILSTKDGYPVQNGLAAVTVVGPRSAVCDALSTTLFIKGTDAGLAFLEQYNAGLLSRTAGGNTAEKGPYYAFFIPQDEGKIIRSPGADALVLREEGR